MGATDPIFHAAPNNLRGVLAFAAGVVYNHSRAMNGSDAGIAPGKRVRGGGRRMGSGRVIPTGSCGQSPPVRLRERTQERGQGGTSAFALSRVVPRSNAIRNAFVPAKSAEAEAFSFASDSSIWREKILAKEKKQEFVTHITPRDEDFSQWYTDVILKTELCDYAPVRGCMIVRPYGYAIWERIQAEMDKRFKETGHQNVYFPMLIPESLLLKEAEHVEGFAPEVAWVTQGGTEKLQERLAVRPTSETIFCTMYAKWVQTWRDLPMKYNQWCSVMRWEKATRPFLRTSEFLWQEGHTIHATAEEAQEETMQMLHVYQEVAEKVMALPVYVGQKSEKEKFAGARATYSMEDMMQDGKALQAGTSHNFGTNFAEAYGIQFQNKEGKLTYAEETSWGVSTRLIGAIIMTHGDERGLRLPPRVAPIQAVILPIAAHKPGVMEACEKLLEELKAADIRVKLDDRDTVSAGYKFNDWEMKGVPVRLEVGPRDLENGVVTVFRRDLCEKVTLPLENLADELKALLDDIQKTLFDQAKKFRDEKTHVVHNMEELGAAVENGFAKAMWCGERACEDEIKEKFNASSRNMPFDQEKEWFGDTCVCCGKKAKKVMYFAKAY